MEVFQILCGCIVVLLLLYYYLTIDFNYWKSRGVKGPKPLPFFGNIVDHFFGKKCIGDMMKDVYDKYPEESMVGMFLKWEPVLVLRNLEYIKHVLIKDFSYFPERKDEIYEKAEPMSMHLFRLDAVRWRPLRTRLSPIFTSGKLKDMFHLLLNCSEHFERYLNKIVPKDGIVECRDLTSKFTMDVIGSCAFGIEMNTMNEDRNRFYEIGRRIFQYNLKTVIRNILRDVPWLYKRIGHFFTDHEMTKFMIDITRDTIEYRKKNNVRRRDFVDALIDLKDHPKELGANNVTDAFIAAQSFVFFGAGFETSATTMSFAMYELAQNHSIQEKVRKEIREALNNNDGVISYDNIKKMSYLDKIFRETLRKYPPVMWIVRKVNEEYTFKETKITIRKGMKVFIPVYGIHNDPSIYPDPDVFDPERFSDENITQRNSMCYLPFGDGPRICIGARFAIFQVKIGLIEVLMNYKIDVCKKTQIPIIKHTIPEMMLQPKNGIYVRLTKLV